MLMKKKPSKTKKVTGAKEIQTKDLAVTVSQLAGAVGDLSATVDNLAVMVARGFERVDGRFGILEEKVDQLGENVQAARRDILNIGDRFVPRYEFDNLLVRLSRLEERMRNKAGK